MFTIKDWAGSGYKMYQAIKRHTDHDIEFYSGKSANLFQHQQGGILITNENRAQVQSRVDSSDIIHLKADWPAHVIQNSFGLKIKHKPIVQTVSGGFFRKKNTPPGSGLGKYPPEMYDDCALRTSFEPDLLYPEYKDCVLTPYPIDSMDKNNIWSASDPPLLVHNPSTRRTKDTAFLLSVFAALKGKVDFETEIPNGRIPFVEADKLKKRATVYFDQFRVGAYGNAAVESMQYGIPVSCWLSPTAISQANGDMDGHPILTAEKDVDAWVEMLVDVLGYNLQALSDRTKKWCDERHSYQAIAKLWDKLYKGIL